MKNGFSILEIVVVLACMTMLITGGLIVYDSVLERIRSVHARTREAVQLYRVLTVMMHDIARGHIASEHITIQDNELIFPVGDESCGYTVQKGNLIRSIGRYSKTHRLWHARTQSLMANHVCTMRIVPVIKTGRVCALKIALQGQYREFSVYCAGDQS